MSIPITSNYLVVLLFVTICLYLLDYVNTHYELNLSCLTNSAF